MKDPKRVLFVNSEIFPYLPESPRAVLGRFLPQGIQEKGKEIRSFMPRFGCINERRNQLHEVIRLSGMNIIVNDVDRPLVIKVSSIPSARMQVYFIDNEDYFHRKLVFNNADGSFIEDNDERAAFFARGVLETVKKLRWKPDIIHCQGWISHLLPVYLKKAYSDDPLFENTKLVLSLYDEFLNEKFSEDMQQKVTMNGIGTKETAILEEGNGMNLAKLAIQYADALVLGDEQLPQELLQAAKDSGLPTLGYFPVSQEETAYVDEYNQFYDQILNIDGE
ncbi:MAG: glycogen/starch synthase [Bacteroidales bacterium]|nr:glycogen/starch synthase [Bacteroidales bacterium]